MLHRLVGGAVFAQANRVMGIDVDGANPHQCAHPHRVAGVVREHQKGRVIRDEAAVQRQSVADRGHAEFAYTRMDVVGIGIAAGHRLAALPQGQIGMRKVSRAAHQFRQQRREGFNRVLRSFAAGNAGAVLLQLGDESVGRGIKPSRERAGQTALELGGGFRVRGLVGRKACIPGGFISGAACTTPPCIDGLRDFKFAVLPTQGGAGGGHFILAQRRAVAGFLARFGG